MAGLNGLKIPDGQTYLRKPETYHQGLEGLKRKIFQDSVMEPGFIESLTAPEGSPIDYQNIESTAGGRAREMFVDPMRKFGTAIDKGMTGKPLTIGDQLNLIEGMIDTTVGGLFQHGLSKGGFDPNTLHMFVGPKAKDIVKAEKMALRGASPAEIQSKMLMHKKPDGFWRKEISDVDTAIDISGTTPLADYPNHMYGKIKDVVKKNKVSELYPEMGEQTFHIGVDTPSKFGGEYRDDYGLSVFVGRENKNDLPKSTILHELQHGVQAQEGWAVGGNPEYVATPDNPEWARWKQSEPLVNEAKALRESPKYKKELGESNKLFTDEYEDRIDDLYDNMTRGSAKLIKVKVDNIFSEFAKVTESKFPTLARIDKLEKLSGGLREPGKKISKHEAYMNLLGEREARSTAERLGMSLEERRGSLPDVGEGSTVLFR